MKNHDLTNLVGWVRVGPNGGATQYYPTWEDVLKDDTTGHLMSLSYYEYHYKIEHYINE